jgi:hypothetical protein
MISMDRKLILLVFVVIVISGCASHKFLPEPENIGVNEYGAYIRLNRTGLLPDVFGELIAIDSSQLIILSRDSSACVTVPIEQIKSFNIKYARWSQYGWTIGVGAILPVVHGWYSFISLPVHYTVTIISTVSSRKTYGYNNKEISLDELRMFARFPQGLPPNVDIGLIK